MGSLESFERVNSSNQPENHIHVQLNIFINFLYTVLKNRLSQKFYSRLTFVLVLSVCYNTSYNKSNDLPRRVFHVLAGTQFHKLSKSSYI